MTYSFNNVLFGAVLTLASATIHAVTVNSEPLHASKQKRLTPAQLQFSSQAFVQTHKIQLTELSREAAKKQLKHSGKQIQIGVNRAVSAPLISAKQTQQEQWQSSRSGKQVMHWEASSPGARAIRLQLSVNQLPAAAQVQFYRPSSSKVIYSVSGKAIHKHLNKKRLAKSSEDLSYWSPVIEGDAAGVEIVLPATGNSDEVNINIQQVAHLLYLPGDKDLADIGSSGSCQVNLACEQATWGDTGNSVAKYVYTDGGTFLCTGTLIADQNSNSQVPYFITANHCISSQSAAATINSYWFFQSSSCFSGNPTTVTQLSGGGDLLATGLDADHTLIRLNETPPSGAVFAGWTTDGVSIGQTITGIHHPVGDLKKISQGRVSALPSTSFGNPNLVNPINVQWNAFNSNTGTTEGGSSGSALFNAQQLVVGTLWGGSSSCSNLFGNDSYGQFSRAFNDFEAFLGQTIGSNSNARLKNISTRAFIGTGSNVAIAGFIIAGSENKDVVIRGLGPSISSLVNTAVIPLPKLEILEEGSNSRLIASNESWRLDSGAAAVEAAGLAPNSNNEAAIKLSLPPGTYTAVLKDSADNTGVGLVAVDDISPDSDSKLINISTRILVQTGDNVAIGGFIIEGSEKKSVVIRAGGPSLANFGIANALNDTVLEVFQGSTLIATNDDWQSATNSSSIESFNLAPSHLLESALLLTLDPGAYTAIVRGFDDATGVGIIAVDEI